MEGTMKERLLDLIFSPVGRVIGFGIGYAIGAFIALKILSK